MSYVAGFESNDDIYPEDVIAENRTLQQDNLDKHIILDIAPEKDAETLLQTLINNEESLTTDDTDAGLFNVGDMLEPAPGEFGEFGGP